MRSALLPAAALLIGLAGTASAAPGFATAPAELRAGPGMNYPPVTFVPGNAPVEILGCLQDYVWCDVAFGQARGWLPAGALGYLYENRALPLAEYGPRFGLPIVGFRFGDYWDNHYRGQPWYGERDRWRGPPPRADFRGPPPDWRPDGRPDGRYEGHREGPPGRGPDWRPEGPPGRGADWRREGPFDRGADRGAERGPERGPDRGSGRGPDRGEDWRREGRADFRGPPGPPPGEGPRRGPDQRGPDQRSPDQRGPDQRGPDQRGPDRRGPEERGAR